MLFYLGLFMQRLVKIYIFFIIEDGTRAHFAEIIEVFISD